MAQGSSALLPLLGALLIFCCLHMASADMVYTNCENTCKPQCGIPHHQSIETMRYDVIFSDCLRQCTNDCLRDYHTRRFVRRQQITTTARPYRQSQYYYY